MRKLPEDEFDQAEAEGLNPLPWMLEALKLNPSYVWWGPGEDYMKAPDEAGGWSSGVLVNDWQSFGPWALDDLNVCVNFYYEIARDAESCTTCAGSGYNPETKEIADSFYAFCRDGFGVNDPVRWCDKITEDELQALRDAGRITGAITSADVNAANNRHTGYLNQHHNNGIVHHDEINRHILIRARATRLGVFGSCKACNGKGYVYTESTSRLALVLWMIHPRKGASRGVVIRNLTEDTLEASKLWLAQAAHANAERFVRVVAGAKTP